MKTIKQKLSTRRCQMYVVYNNALWQTAICQTQFHELMQSNPNKLITLYRERSTVSVQIKKVQDYADWRMSK